MTATDPRLRHERRHDDFSDCLTADRPRLRRLARDLGRNQGAKRERLQADLDALRARSRATLAERQARLPKPDFPAELPVTQRRDEIAAAIAAHQVVIVCGETGSGKTTQLPKICLALGRGAAGLIGHTQPRRLAARATATRIAQELKSELGQAVGYKIRFTDRLSEASCVKLMTDGILLAETQGDPTLAAYDTLIIDEAHERSLNIDFLLGYLRTLLPRRPDLKVIVTSATLDADRFARHFAAPDGKPAPVIEVSGRLYPIELRYRPVESDDEPAQESRRPGADRRKDRDLYDAIVDAVDEAHRSGPGGTLVFLPGEREIREATEALRKAHHAAGTEILPLYARQSAQDQARVFAPGKGRRVVLATNVAETSLTVPGIRYVVDTGLARVKRYSHRNKVEQLQVEKIAQSAAKQRAGRCGRVMDGVCFRLYDEDDLGKRPAHTDPEILRSSLAGVILRMKSLRLGAVEDFPFIDAPLPRMVADGYQLLTELGAVSDDDARELTPIGVELAKLPLDPKIGRMILAARDRGCLSEVLVIAAALSTQDPRERNPESPGAADQAHAKFRGGEQDQRSEFLWYWNLWKAWAEVLRHETGSKQKAWAKQHHLSYMRLREWRDVHTQLHTLCTEHGWKENDKPAHYDALHKALLAGLLGHVGCKIEDASGPQAGSYLGARGIKFWPHPGSALAKKAGKWIVCAELVDTSRLFGRCLAKIEPEWLEEVGAHLIKCQVFEPHWSKATGAVRAWERGTLHGLVLYARRGVGYRDTDPLLCRELFIREGLVQGEIAEGAARGMPFLQHNRRLVAEIERLEHKSRRPDVLVDEELIHAFYEAKLPEDILDLPSFEAWRKTAEKAEPKLLHLSRDQLMRHEAEGITTDRFPASLEVLGQKLKLTYLHQPGEADDGVTLTVPLAMLNQIPANRCEWLVPGLLEEKVAALLRTVPQKHRHRLQPISESAAAFMEHFDAGEWDTDEALLRALQRFVEERVSLKLPMESFRAENLNPHCFMNFRVIDEHGRVLGQSRNLAELRTRLRDQVAERFRGARIAIPESALTKTALPPPSEKGSIGQGAPAKAAPEAPASQLSGITAWTFGELPELLEVKVAGREVIGFPALHDDDDSVSLRPFDTPEEAAKVHRKGLARLFALTLKDQVRAIEKLPGLRELALAFIPFGTEAELKAQLVAATLARTCLLDPLPADAASFERRCTEAKPRITLIAQEFMRLAIGLIAEHAALQKRLTGLKGFPEVAADIQAQVRELMPKDFLVAFPWERLAHFTRYLKAAGVRLDKLRNNPARDAQLLADWRGLAQPFERERLAKRKAGVDDPSLDEFRWLLEELRVGLFAQELKTPMPMSVKRLQKIWDARPR
ncbi:ATP-dependent RNA helicase HrpA [Aromatoleum toluolicum]|uniref:ATP-dependent RNA helicase HrpA n=1 Tax=Aromatoleum toluolicum TaxID=90060 RepID=A0ABX1NNX4_9RHOO|nr:ATP-dependent RNA helicase HrpA [Aromatoleum toluolicum]NMG01050.1 ATP-dependent RNA helicase HrpA [Aromatoleum toluolicum]